MKNKCQKCNKNCEKDFCFQHKPKKALARSQIKTKSFVAQKTEKDKALDNLQQNAMLVFFQELWKKRKQLLGTNICIKNYVLKRCIQV